MSTKEALPPHEFIVFEKKKKAIQLATIKLNKFECALALDAAF